MKRAFETTWGAHLMPEGVRFRLWAPAARRVEVLFPSENDRACAMERSDDGWFQTLDPQAKAASEYLYRIDGGLCVADPASRFQPLGPENVSAVVDPNAFDWPGEPFTAPPYAQAVIYELHVGTFTREGTYAAAAQRLQHVADLGATAIELLPLAQAPGVRDWGYDGVHTYAPAHAYGSPEDLKRFIVAAHRLGLAVLLDVVYNHFGPQGNYLTHYAPEFFSNSLLTPWGDGIDYSHDAVRRFAIDNACYWLTEYAFDGLRLDATPMIVDSETPHILDEIRTHAQRAADRPVYFIAEDVKNEIVDRVRPYDGRWSDDPHDALHVLLTDDESEYYDPFRSRPLTRFAQTLADEGLHLVAFLQNHDRVGNRPFGERITALAPDEAVRAATAIVLLAPAVPLLFMGEEWGASSPFLFFCDFEAQLAQRVAAGRRREFSQLAEFADPDSLWKIPDPSSPQTFNESKLNWNELAQPQYAARLQWYRDLLARRKTLMPQLASAALMTYEVIDRVALHATWQLQAGATLQLAANLSARVCERIPGADGGRIVYCTHKPPFSVIAPPWSVRWSLQQP